MKKLISILLIVTMLTVCLSSCELKEKITGLFGKEEETTTAAPEETTTKAPEETTTTQPPQEDESTTPEPWRPGGSDKDDKQPIELPSVGVRPTIGE